MSRHQTLDTHRSNLDAGSNSRTHWIPTFCPTLSKVRSIAASSMLMAGSVTSINFFGATAAIAQTTAFTCNNIYVSVQSGAPTNGYPVGKEFYPLNWADGTLGAKIGSDATGVTGGIGIDPSTKRIYYLDGNGGSGYSGIGKIWSFDGINAHADTTHTIADPTAEHQAGMDLQGILWSTKWTGTKDLYKYDKIINAANQGAIAAASSALATEWSNLSEGDFVFDKDNKMWFVSTYAPTGQIAIWTIDRSTRVATKVGNYTPSVALSATHVVTGGAFGPDGKMYIGTSLGHIYKFDIFSNTLTALKTTNGSTITDMTSCMYPAISIAGKVWNDLDNSANNTFNNINTNSETGTNGGGLNAILIDGNNRVIATTSVASNGTYSLNNLSGNQTGLKIRLSTNAGTVGQTAPTAAVPSGWANTSPLQTINFDSSTTNIIGKDFGIEQLPNTNNVTGTSQTNPIGRSKVHPDLSGTDPEDGTLGTGKSFKIVTLPTNGILYYNNIAVTIGQVITSYVPDQLTIDPNDGALTVTFTYSAIDLAGKQDPTPATVSMPFTVASAAGSPFTCDGRFYQIRSTTSNNSELFLINRFNNPFVKTSVVSTPTGIVLNGLAYNPKDNFMYALLRGINSSDLSGVRPGMTLYRLGNGSVTHVGDIAGLPTGFTPTAADFGPDGSYYVTRAEDSTPTSTELYKINVATQTATLTTMSQITGNIGDMAYNPKDNFLYGIGGAGNQVLFKIDPSNGTVTPSALSLTDNWGTAFFDPIGTFYGYANSGNFYRIDLATGVATLLSNDPGASANATDGATCQFTSEKIDVVKAAGVVNRVNSTTFDVAYTIKVKNTGAFNAPNVQITENLNQTFSTGAPTISIQVAPIATGGITTVNTAFDGITATKYNLLSGVNSLAGGASATVTFTVRLVYPNVAAVPNTLLNNQVYASTMTSTTTPGTPNPGYTFPSGIPVPPPDLLTADASTNGMTLPTTANGDVASPTPIMLPTASNVLLVKRITAINGTPINTFTDNTNALLQATNDNSIAWPLPLNTDASKGSTNISSFLRGAIDGISVKPGDVIEYTIYFVNTGGSSAKNVRICDRIIGAQAFVDNAYGANQDIEYQLGSNAIRYLTKGVNTSVDRAYLDTIGTVSGCNSPTIAGTNGTVSIDVTGTSSYQDTITAIPGATPPGTANSYGYFRFKTKVKL